ncbi:MAG: hypothetical protein M8354_08090 [Halalkalicoccus sp.]|nr:hypothetical protein [Halalkalicoccus sp.]
MQSIESIESIVSKENLVQYVYTLGVMVTGVGLGDQLGGFDSTPLWAALVVVALGWVVYYHFVLVPRLEQTEDEEQETLDESR